MNPTTLLASVLLAVTPLAAAMQADTAYRWVDALGHVHYSQSPPPGTAAAAVKIVPPPVPTSSSPAERQSLEIFLHAQQAAQKKQAAAQRAESERLARQQKRCAAARQRLQEFQASHTVLPEADSNAIGDFGNDRLIARQTRLQQQVSSACKSG